MLSLGRLMPSNSKVGNLAGQAKPLGMGDLGGFTLLAYFLGVEAFLLNGSCRGHQASHNGLECVRECPQWVYPRALGWLGELVRG